MQLDYLGRNEFGSPSCEYFRVVVLLILTTVLPDGCGGIRSAPSHGPSQLVQMAKPAWGQRHAVAAFRKAHQPSRHRDGDGCEITLVVAQNNMQRFGTCLANQPNHTQVRSPRLKFRRPKSHLA